MSSAKNGASLLSRFLQIDQNQRKFPSLKTRGGKNSEMNMGNVVFIPPRVKHKFARGRLFWAVILRPFFSRRVVGWKLEDRLEAGLVHQALQTPFVPLYCVRLRPGLYFRSDRGCQYRQLLGPARSPKANFSVLPCETRSSKEGIRPGPIVVVTVRWSASFLRG
jgi:hypothetical protein